MLSWQEQFELGQRYLSEGNYEEAVLAFAAAVEIDPKQVDAYIALAEIYTRQGETGKAMEVLKRAIDEIGETEQLTAALAELAAAEPGTDGEQKPEEQGQSRTERQELGDGSYVIITYDEEGNKVSENYYDAAGNLVKEVTYSADDSMISIMTREYGTAGDLIRMSFYYKRGEHSGITDVYEYDAAGNELPMVRYWHNQEGAIQQIDEHDADGNIIKITIYLPDGTEECYWVNEYDSAGNRVRETEYGADNTVWQYRINEYDNAGNKVKSTDYRPNGTVTGYRNYEYNSEGKLVRETVHDEDGTVLWDNEFDGMGN